MGQVSVARIFRKYNYEESINVQGTVAQVAMLREDRSISKL